MGVARRAALMTVRDNVIGDPLAHPLIKDKVFANEAHRQPLLAGATGVLDDATSMCQTLLKPLCFIRALAFSQRMPPVQYMTIFLSLWSCIISTAFGSWSRKVSAGISSAFSKWPTSYS